MLIVCCVLSPSLRRSWHIETLILSQINFFLMTCVVYSSALIQVKENLYTPAAFLNSYYCNLTSQNT